MEGLSSMKTAVCRIDLGYTRIAGYVLYDSKSLEFEETTPREVEKLNRKNKIFKSFLRLFKSN